jgi:hypothetical protein
MEIMLKGLDTRQAWFCHRRWSLSNHGHCKATHAMLDDMIWQQHLVSFEVIGWLYAQ